MTLQRLNGTGTVWVDDVRCEEGVSRKEDKSYYYHCDYLGSPRVMTDPLGNVIWRQDYYAFGGDYASTSLGNSHKFTGHVQDAATGQYYAKARYFTTGLGRWSQPEPLLKGVPGKGYLVEPQKLNPYVYCLNNPVRIIDPDGKNPLVLGAGIAGVGGVIGAGVEMLKLAGTHGVKPTDFGYAATKGFLSGSISTTAFMLSAVGTGGNLVLAGAASGAAYTGISQGFDLKFKGKTPSIGQAVASVVSGAILGPITGLANPVGRPTSLSTPLTEIGTNGIWALKNAGLYNMQGQAASILTDILSQDIQQTSTLSSSTPKQQIISTGTQQNTPNLPQTQTAEPDNTR